MIRKLPCRSSLIPAPAELAAVACAAERLADAIDAYDGILGGREAAALRSEEARSALAGLLRAFIDVGDALPLRRIAPIRTRPPILHDSGTIELPAPDPKDGCLVEIEVEAWPDSKDVADELNHLQNLWYELAKLLNPVFPLVPDGAGFGQPNGPMGTEYVYEWWLHAKSGERKGKDKGEFLACFGYYPLDELDELDELAAALEEAGEPSNSLAWSLAETVLAAHPDVTSDYLQELVATVRRVGVVGSADSGATLEFERMKAELQLRAAKRREWRATHIDPAVFPETVEVHLTPDFLWPKCEAWQSETCRPRNRETEAELGREDLASWFGHYGHHLCLAVDDLTPDESDAPPASTPPPKPAAPPASTPPADADNAVQELEAAAATSDPFATGVPKQLDGIAYAAELAWNLREWLRECAERPSLRPVLDSLLPSLRANLVIELVDADLACQASRLPSEDLTAESLIASIGAMRFAGGSAIKLPEGEPPEKWPTLARYRARILAARMVDDQGQRLFDPDNPNDLESLERLDGHLLQQLWQAGKQLDSGQPNMPPPPNPEPATPAESDAPPASTPPGNAAGLGSDGNIYGAGLYPSPLVFSEVITAGRRLTAAVRRYQEVLAGKPAGQLTTLEGKAAWLSLVDAMPDGRLPSDIGDILSFHDEEIQGWEESEDLAAVLENAGEVIRILRKRLSGVLPEDVGDLRCSVCRWYLKPRKIKGKCGPQELLAYWAYPDEADELAAEIDRSEVGMNTLAWGAARQRVEKAPTVSYDQLDSLVQACRALGPERGVEADVLRAELLLRVEEREEGKLVDFAINLYWSEWESFDYPLEESSFVWPDLGELTVEDYRSLPELEYDATSLSDQLGMALDELALLSLKRVAVRRVSGAPKARFLAIPPEELPHDEEAPKLPYPWDVYEGDPFERAREIEAREGITLPDGGNPLRLLWRYKQFAEQRDPRNNVTFAQYLCALGEAFPASTPPAAGNAAAAPEPAAPPASTPRADSAHEGNGRNGSDKDPLLPDPDKSAALVPVHFRALLGNADPAVSIGAAIRTLADNIDAFTYSVRRLMKLTPNDRGEWFTEGAWTFPVPSRDSRAGMLAGTLCGVPNPNAHDDTDWTEADKYFAAIQVLLEDIMKAQPFIYELIDAGVDRWLRIPFERSPGAWTSELLFELRTVSQICRRVFGCHRVRAVPAGQFGRFRRAEKAELLKCLDALETKRDKLLHLDMATVRADVDAAVFESFGWRPAKQDVQEATPETKAPPASTAPAFRRVIRFEGTADGLFCEIDPVTNEKSAMLCLRPAQEVEVWVREGHSYCVQSTEPCSISWHGEEAEVVVIDAPGSTVHLEHDKSEPPPASTPPAAGNAAATPEPAAPAANSPPTDDNASANQGSDTAGILVPPDKFQYKGKTATLTSIPWKLLRAMWHQQSRDITDVEDEVWPCDQKGDPPKDIGATLNRVNNALASVFYPRRIGKKGDYLTWKPA